MTNSSGNTPYETNPVENLFDAIKSFAAAFDAFYKSNCNCCEQKKILDSVKAALYKPVYPNLDTSAPICLFEIGFMYVPGTKNSGIYMVNEEKLAAALQQRENDIKSLFTKSDGLLNEVIPIMTDFLAKELTEEEYVSGKGFLNECLRLEAMF